MVKFSIYLNRLVFVMVCFLTLRHQGVKRLPVHTFNAVTISSSGIAFTSTYHIPFCPSFGASGGLCFAIVAFPGYLYLYFSYLFTNITFSLKICTAITLNWEPKLRKISCQEADTVDHILATATTATTICNHNKTLPFKSWRWVRFCSHTKDYQLPFVHCLSFHRLSKERLRWYFRRQFF